MRGLLDVRCVNRSFGGVSALKEITFGIHSPSIFAIIGPNGAGKTTLLNLITGLDRPNNGRILFRGEDVTGMAPWKIAARGIARTLQTPGVFPDMTVRENVMIGALSHRRLSMVGAVLRLPRARSVETAASARAESALALVDMVDQSDRLAGELPFGPLRLVELARTLASEPRLLLLDEPAAGLSAGEAERLADLLQALYGEGIAICLVEHNMHVVMSTAHRVLVLDHGESLVEGTPTEVQADPKVRAAYLGERDDAEERARAFH